MSNPLKKRTTPSVRFIECYDEQDEEDSLRLREELNDGPSIEEMERAYLQAEKDEQEVEQEAEKAYQRQLRERREQERNDPWNARAEAERTIRDELERKYQADLEQEWAASVEYERMYRTSMEQKWAAREAQVAEKERLLQEEVDRLKREGLKTVYRKVLNRGRTRRMRRGDVTSRQGRKGERNHQRAWQNQRAA